MWHLTNTHSTFTHSVLLTQLVTIYGKHYILNPLDSWRPEVKKALSSSTFSMSCATRSPSPFSTWSLLSLVFLLLCCTCRSPSCDFHIPQQIQVQMGFGFPNPIPVCSDSVSIFLFGQMSLLASPVCFLFMFQFNQELLAHPWRPPATSVWFPTPGGGPFLSLEEAILEN